MDTYYAKYNLLLENAHEYNFMAICKANVMLYFKFSIKSIFSFILYFFFRCIDHWYLVSCSHQFNFVSIVLIVSLIHLCVMSILIKWYSAIPIEKMGVMVNDVNCMKTLLWISPQYSTHLFAFQFQICLLCTLFYLVYCHVIVNMDDLLTWDTVMMVTLIYQNINLLYIETLNAVNRPQERIVLYPSQCQGPGCMHSLSNMNKYAVAGTSLKCSIVEFVIIAFQSEFKPVFACIICMRDISLAFFSVYNYFIFEKAWITPFLLKHFC